MTEISKTANPTGFAAARSLGSSQRALRNSFRKDVTSEAKTTIAAQKAGKNPSMDKYTEKITGMADDYKTGREKLRVDQRQLSTPKRLVSNVAQYPARWAGGSAVAAGGGTVASDRVRKSDVGPFGVEMISKKDVSKDPAYRESIYQPINPRSKTYVKRGTGSAARRVGGPFLGGSIGAAGGAALGAGTPASVPLAYAGAIGGASLLHTRNVRSGDTVGINRRTGKKAKSKVGASDVSVYNYNM